MRCRHVRIVLLLLSLSSLLRSLLLFEDLAAAPSGSRTWLAIGRGLGGRPCTAGPRGRPRIVRQSSSGLDGQSLAESYLLSWGLPEEQMAKLRGRCRAKRLTADVESRIKPTLEWFSELGLSDSQIQKVVTRYPKCFESSLEDGMKPRVRWLSDLGMNESQVVQVVVSFPGLLAYSLDNKCRPTVQTLRDLGFANSQIVEVLTRKPNILSYSSKRLVDRTSILKTQGRLTVSSLFRMADSDAQFAARFGRSAK
mmetsp:Transcript_150046/g.482259  ORF Transcript_150046/g.482259 Transcript_150046/m.482259 type:complete len:253 (-) Transcript_150046:15-773(-)